MIHGFLKACTVSPALRVADCAFNTQQTIAAMQRVLEREEAEGERARAEAADDAEAAADTSPAAA